MKKSNFKKLDLSFLPENLAKEAESRLEKALAGLKKIRWPIRAVVLGGGYKHKELTYSEKGIGSDIDLFIFSNFIPFFWKKLTRIQREINKDKFFFHYRGIIPLFLGKSKTFWAYKLKQEGIVLKGDKNILRKIRATEDNIPKIEAIRILFQTLVVWLTLAEVESKNSNKKLNSFTILRSYLNIGESYLTFFGYLKPSYRERMEEFKKRADKFGLKEETRKKIILGYLTKVNPEQAKQECEKYQLSLLQAKQDCIKAANDLLSLYFKTNVPLDEKLDILAKEIRPHYLLNLAPFYFLKDLKGIKPKFFSTVFRFKITELWKATAYHHFKKLGERDRTLKKYFILPEFSDRTLIKIFEAHPSYTMIEIS